MHELKRTQEAYDKLLPVVNLFPEEYVIPYNLACYSCQLGKMDEASQWLEKAAQTGEFAANASSPLHMAGSWKDA